MPVKLGRPGLDPIFSRYIWLMSRDRLKASPLGRNVRIVAPDPVTKEIVEDEAYLPDRLPHEISLSTATWTAVNNATAALARLDGTARLIPSPGLLRRPTLRREAQSTSALEGTYAPFADVLAADRDDPASMTAELREVLNFEQVAEQAFAWPAERPITVGMLGELQRTLVCGTASELSDAGGLRDRIVVIGSRGRGFAEARYIPPPPGDQLKAGVETYLDGWPNRRSPHCRSSCHGSLSVRVPAPVLRRERANRAASCDRAAAQGRGRS